MEQNLWIPRFFEAVKKGDLMRVKQLLRPTNTKSKSNDVNAKNRSGGTALYSATEKNHLDIVRLLLSKGADVNLTVEPLSYTALILAANMGHTEIAEELLKHGAEVDFMGKDCTTALFRACNCGHMETARTILKYGAKVNLVQGYDENRTGYENVHTTPLFTAAEEGHLDVVRCLVEHGACVNLPVVIGKTPFYIAVQRGYTEIAKFLIEHGAEIDKPIDNQATVLLAASQLGHVDMVQLLLEKGANPNAATDAGATPLYLASHEGEKEVMKLLLKHGADTEVRFLGCTALVAASEENRDTEEIQLLLNAGADVNACSPEGDTALHNAVKHRNLEFLHEILKHKPAIPKKGKENTRIAQSDNEQTDNEYSALDFARDLRKERDDVTGKEILENMIQELEQYFEQTLHVNDQDWPELPQRVGNSTQDAHLVSQSFWKSKNK